MLLLIILTFFIIQKFLRKIDFPLFIDKFINIVLYKLILKKLNPYFTLALNSKYKYKQPCKNLSKVIWIFWWQGEKNMPKIVKACIDSIIRNSLNHKVIIITKYNIRNYTDISDVIFSKLNEGKITYTHFSDIVRFNLLYNHGGLWIDSTVYCSKKMSPQYFSNFYTSYGDYNFKWTSFLIGGNNDNELFRFMNEFFKIYWKKNNKIIIYFMMDYALKYAYDMNIGDFKNYVDHESYKNNPNMFKLCDYMNSSYDKTIYYNLIKDTGMFKLTYKHKFKYDGDTFYYRLINDKLG
ncbi:capsular polysaccharide synthesis protein [Apilactobacillus timberlakei]|uniref:capsular polysaccharide synthesis protein n=1 Tax=Apilactobacillus timberlakei TaxID=2008380 RepID=UPI001CDBF62A|nr:capsular polysaccharide synthesis protein [Apilactobacillus timberlakei]